MTRVYYRVALPARIWEDPPALRSYIETTLHHLPNLTGVRAAAIAAESIELLWTAFRPPVLDDEGRCTELEQSAPQDIHDPLPEWASGVFMNVFAELHERSA